MLKALLITAVTAVAAVLPAPTVAATPHDFDPSLVTRRQTLDGQCYKTQDQSKVCFFRAQGETYNVAIRDSKNPEYPHVFTVNCNTGVYKGFGPMSNAQNQAFAAAFCNSGRY